jgi:hypothetical protein
MAFANAAGSGLPLHHDRYDQLFFQIRGRKQFQYAPNGYVGTPDLQFSPTLELAPGSALSPSTPRTSASSASFVCPTRRRFEDDAALGKLRCIVLSGPSHRPQTHTVLAVEPHARPVLDWIVATQAAFTVQGLSGWRIKS